MKHQEMHDRADPDVFCLYYLRTSVPEACFPRLGRKFYPPCSYRLPSLRPVFGVWDGSFTPHTLTDFRPRGPFSAFGTEVSLPMPLSTSVPEAYFRRLGRKFRSPCSYRLPSPRPVFGVWDGRFALYSLADFRP